jgi:hypothetical protein
MQRNGVEMPIRRKDDRTAHGLGEARPSSAARRAADRTDAEAARIRQEELLDEALAESFPASDPLSSLRFT